MICTGPSRRCSIWSSTSPRSARDRSCSCASRDPTSSTPGRVSPPTGSSSSSSRTRRSQSSSRHSGVEDAGPATPHHLDVRGQPALRRAARGHGRRLRAHGLPSSSRRRSTLSWRHRIDGLEPAERRTLERACVVGKEFWHRAIVELSSPADRPCVTGRLMALVRKGLVAPSRSELPGEDAYRFRHSLDLRRDLRGDAEGGARRAARAVCALAPAPGAGRERGSASTTRSSATTSSRPTAAGRSSCRTTSRRGRSPARPERCWRAPDDVRSDGRMCRPRSSCSTAPSSCWRGTSPIAAGLLTELGSATMRARGMGPSTRTSQRGGRIRARVAGNRQSELRATIELQWQRSFTEPAEAADEDRRVAEALIPELERLKDHLGLAKAWWLLSESHLIAGRWAARTDALEQAIFHARQLPDKGQLRVLLVIYAQALYYGPTPVPEAVRTCAELLAEAPGSPTFEAGIATTLAGLRAMEGRFAEARELYADSIAVYQEFGLRFRRAARSIVGAQIESFAGDLAAAEQRATHELRDAGGDGRERRSLGACRAADRSSLSAGPRRRGRAVQWRSQRETAAETDVMPQVLWRRALARTTIHRGDSINGREALAERGRARRGNGLP